MRTEAVAHPAIPLARWAGRKLAELTAATGTNRIAALDGATLLGERAALNGFAVPRHLSAGGGCRLIAARDGWVALNLARSDDRELLPALFRDAAFDPGSDVAVEHAVERAASAALVGQAREIGLAAAHWGEEPASPAVTVLAVGRPRPEPARPPLVLDLSALWAGPLAAHLLWLAGARVIKLESATRPDAMRQGDPPLFARLNQGKDSVLLDFAQPEGRRALLDLLARADIVIEASRPRALRQLGADAEALLRDRPGLVWMTITAHGASGPGADWIGFGDDCGVAGGLAQALFEASGTAGFVGDAIADPLTGIVAASEAWRAWAEGGGRRIGVAMSGVVAGALAEERRADRGRFDSELRAWAAAAGEAFPRVPARDLLASLRPLGSDSAKWLGAPAPC